MSDQAPKRCLFRFSLRTMFLVVTMFGALAGWSARNLHLVRQRNLLYSRNAELVSQNVPPIKDSTRWIPSPGVLWLFGDKPRQTINLWVEAESVELLPDSEREKVVHACRLFHEQPHVVLYGRGKDGVWIGSAAVNSDGLKVFPLEDTTERLRKWISLTGFKGG